VEEDGKWSVVCDAYEDETPGICGNHSKAWPLFQEDARLIAAAPDMLAALRAMDQICPRLQVTDDEKRAFDLLDSAIVKATGAA